MEQTEKQFTPEQIENWRAFEGVQCQVVPTFTAYNPETEKAFLVEINMHP